MNKMKLIIFVGSAVFICALFYLAWGLLKQDELALSTIELIITVGLIVLLGVVLLLIFKKIRLRQPYTEEVSEASSVDNESDFSHRVQLELPEETNQKAIIMVSLPRLGIICLLIGAFFYILWIGWLGAIMLVVYFRLWKYVPDPNKARKQFFTEGFVPPIFYTSFVCWVIYIVHLLRGGVRWLS